MKTQSSGKTLFIAKNSTRFRNLKDQQKLKLLQCHQNAGMNISEMLRQYSKYNDKEFTRTTILQPSSMRWIDILQATITF